MGRTDAGSKMASLHALLDIAFGASEIAGASFAISGLYDIGPTADQDGPSAPASTLHTKLDPAARGLSRAAPFFLARRTVLSIAEILSISDKDKNWTLFTK